MRKPKTRSTPSTVKAAKVAKTQTFAPTLTDPQKAFFDTQAKFSAYIGGVGSGKTWVGAMRLLAQPAGSITLVLAPTYGMLRDAVQPTFWAVIAATGLPPEIVVDHNISTQTTTLSNGSVIFWRSADDPKLLRGLSVNGVWIDECAFVTRDAYDVAIARMRAKGEKKLWITSTPNGKNWLYKLFCVDFADNPKYQLVRSKTSENIYLDADYLDPMRASYSSTQAAQELDGEFVEKGNARIRAEWIRKTAISPKGIITVGVDLASSTKERADYTAMVAVVNGRGIQHVLDADRHKLSFHESTEQILAFAKRNRARIIYVEKTQYQAAACQELQRLARGSGIAIKGVSPQGSKLMRFMPLEARIESGTITFSTGLPDFFFEEVLDFSGDGRGHDDQCDALVYACENEINKRGGSFFEVEN